MAVFKCKMCSGELEITEGITVVECEYCGTKQTVPTAKDENLHSLFNRANTLRIKGEFDKAEKIYEKIIDADETQAEAYWGLILCKYGIEYVEDPATFKRVPTCHRASFDSIVADDDYKTALKYADGVQRGVYEAEAVEIDRIQKEILALSQKEEPYDVFICYKETDETGRRTQDSVIANDIYHQLTQEGFKVFYAAITLENKLGSAYEPCIFAALNSAKVMLAIGTKPEYFNAVWVKNEWSRYLKLIKTDRSRILIPCYRDMDAYELPEEFSHLQAQDMSKIGFINDVVRGIKKVIIKDEPVVIKTETVVKESANGNVTSLLKRGFMALEDGEWNKADDFFEQALNFDAELAEAYLGKLMAELKVRKKDDLKNCAEPFNNNSNYQKAIRFGDDKLVNSLNEFIAFINARNYTTKMNSLYDAAVSNKNNAKTEAEYIEAAKLFDDISEWKDSAKLMSECRSKAEEYRTKEENDRQVASEIKKENMKKLRKICIILGSVIVSTCIVCCIITSITRAIKTEQLSPFIDKETIIATNYHHAIGLKSYGKVVAIGENNYGQCYVSGWKDIIAVSAGYNHTVGLKSDGTVVATGNNDDGQCDVSSWTDIIAVSAGSNHTVGLKADGTLVAVGNSKYGQCAVSQWTDIVAISADPLSTVALKSDGTIMATGIDFEGTGKLQKHANVISFDVGADHVVSLKADGTVVATGDNDDGQCNVSGWRDIIAVSTSYYTVGLKSDGTVVATGENDDGQCNVSGWKDIIAVSAGSEHTVGLKSDGTVVATGNNDDGQCDVSDWKDIIAVVAEGYYTVGLKSDGTVVATGDNYYGQCNVLNWDLF